VQHFFSAFDQTIVTQEGESRTFEAQGHIDALQRALNIIGWRFGDPMPSGLWFERRSPQPLQGPRDGD